MKENQNFGFSDFYFPFSFYIEMKGCFCIYGGIFSIKFWNRLWNIVWF